MNNETTFSNHRDTKKFILDIILPEGIQKEWIKHMVEVAGFPEEDARIYANEPMQMEFCLSGGNSVFAIESGAVDQVTLVDPFTGKEITVPE